MHLLTTTSTNLDELVEAVDLGQPPGDIVVLSFAHSDLAGLAAAWEAERAALPSVRLAHLRELRHPMSVDLWINRVGAHAKVIVVRLLGGLDWWKYGIEQLSALARERNIALAVLPGEDRDDARLAAASTVPHQELDALLGYFREGGRENLRALLRRLAGYAGYDLKIQPPQPLPRQAGYLPGQGAVALDRLTASLDADKPVIPIIFYRAMLLAADTAPVDALYTALSARGLAPAPLVVTSLKDKEAAAFLREALAKLSPAVIVTTTAFAAGGNVGEPTPLDAPDVPVLQVISATTKRAAWESSPRGLGAADLAMHVVLPELDGRILAGAVAFKDPVAPQDLASQDLASQDFASQDLASQDLASQDLASQDLASQDALAFTALASRPEPDRVAFVADRIAALARLRALPRGERRVAILMPDYPGAAGRNGYAVGLDVPASVLALLEDLRGAGYAVGRRRGIRASCSTRSASAMRSFRSNTMRTCLPGCRPPLPRACATRGARRPTMPMSATALFIFVLNNLGNSGSRCHPIAGAVRSGAPTITTQRCHRGMLSSRSVYGCNTRRKPMRSSTWARTGPWNGCPVRRWR